MKFKTLIVPALIGAAACLSFTSDVRTTEVYNFDSEVVMEMKEFLGDIEQRTSNIKFYSSAKHSHLGFVMDISTHGQDMTAQIVNDAENNTMTTFIDQGGMKMAMQYDLSKMKEMPVAAGDNPDHGKSKITKTGRTKTILGYKCDEYEVTNNKSHSLAWIAKDLKMASFYDAFTKMKGNDRNWNTEMPEGFPMEIISWPNGYDTKEKFVIRVTEVNKNKSKSISTEGYSIMKLN